MTSTPRAQSLIRILCIALENYLPSVVAHMQQSIHVYSGSGVKFDGNFDIASRIVTVGRRGDGRWALTCPYSVLLGWLGPDGGLLEVPTPARTEHWDDVEPPLDALTDKMIANRADAGLPLHAQIAASHSVDTYGRHRLKLRRFYSRKYRACCLRTVAPTPLGEAMHVDTSDCGECPTEITGEALHDHFNLRPLVTPAANDCRNILSDHKDGILRLSAKEAPASADNGAEAVGLPSRSAERLLRTAVEATSEDAIRSRDGDAVSADAVKAFIQQPNVQKSPIWKRLFKAVPPRGAVVRIARLFDTTVDESLGFFNYKDAHSFKQEMLRILRWWLRAR